jgi:hypothetical protein
MWLNADPAMGEYIPLAPIDDEAKQHNKNLPGMGGVFNYVNLHAYHYAGNNPVKYTDPDGNYLETGWDVFSLTMGLVSFRANINDGKYLAATVDIFGIIVDAAATATPVPGGANATIKAIRGIRIAADVTVSTTSAIDNFRNDRPFEGALDIAGAALTVASVGGDNLLAEAATNSHTASIQPTNAGFYGRTANRQQAAGTIIKTSNATVQTTRVVSTNISKPTVQAQNRNTPQNKYPVGIMPTNSSQYKPQNFGLMCQ